VAWRAQIGPSRPMVVNVNLSRRQIVHRGLVPMLKRVLNETGVRPGDVKLEVTETAIMDGRTNAVEVLHKIRELGLELAMDDFGTGQSSLSCLRQFPIQCLKIDRAFLMNITRQREFSAVVHAIITLAHNLNLDVVAEGLEDESQLAQLQAMDCKYAQGHLFSPAVTPDLATQFLDGGLPYLSRVTAA
jgi:EAL domain-containing protein (putative c-di-GMP-specific phosphodiesterase class I)